MPPDLLASLHAYGLSWALWRACRRASLRNWRHRSDRLRRGQLRRDLAILRWARDQRRQGATP